MMKLKRKKYYILNNKKKKISLIIQAIKCYKKTL